MPVTLPGTGQDVATSLDTDNDHVQHVKIVRSDTGVPLDATSGGLRVYLGSALPGGGNNIGNVDVASIAGVDVIDLGTHAGLGVYVLNGSGDPQSLAVPARVKVTPTLSTSPAYTAGDTLTSADLDFAGAGVSGIVTGLTIIDRDDLTRASDAGQIRVDLFTGAVDPGTANGAYAITDDTESSKYIASISTLQGGPAQDGTWTDLGPAKVIFVPCFIPYATDDGDTLMATLLAISTFSGNSSSGGLDIILHFHRD